jgi:hypothetical protein
VIAVDAYLVDLKQEWYADAVDFYQESLGLYLGKGDLLRTLRDLRGAIIFSCISIETTINAFILAHVEKNKNSMEQSVIDKWTEKERYVSIETKLTTGVELWNKTLNLTQRADWVWFKDLKKKRDDLIHPKKYDDLYDVKKLLGIAYRGISATGEIVIALIHSYPGVSAHPPTFDRKPTPPPVV